MGKIGIGGGKSKSTQNETTHQVVTPNAPQYVQEGLAGVGDRFKWLNTLDPYSLVPGANSLQTNAGNLSGSLGAGIHDARVAFGSNMGGATNATNDVINASAPQMTAASLLDGLPNYMSPYTDRVVDTTLANYDRTAGTNRQQQLLNLGNMDDTFGGSGGLAYLGNFDAANLLNRAQTEATLRDQGFNTGANLSNLDAGRRQEASATNAQLQAQQNALKLAAAQQLAGLGQTAANTEMAFDANQRQNAGAQADIGAILRDIQQQGALAPLTFAQGLGSIWSGAPWELVTGQTTDGTATGVQKGSNFQWGAQVGWNPKSGFG